MKVLLATPEDRATLGVIGGYCAGALKGLGHEVEIFDFRRRPYSRNAAISALKAVARPLFPRAPSPYDMPVIKGTVDRKINNALLEQARRFRPDILLVLFGENILPGTLETLRRELGTVSANWFYDTLLAPRRQGFIASVLPAYDHVFIVDSQEILKSVPLRCKRVATLPLACDPRIHRRVELAHDERAYYGSDIAFVGTVTPEREKVLEAVGDLDIKIWGRWQRVSPLLRKRYQKKDIYAEEAVKVYNASKIVLDIHSLFGSGQEIFNVTPRLFEVPASGGFLLTNRASQISALYKAGEEIVTYADTDDLRRKIAYYLEHPDERSAIAARSYEKAHEKHTYKNRIADLLDIARS
ncbi:MAG: glycosyltransferase [Candidatus Omnitrophica bacterium]|nr:glycosyltransferase [Candidatus Omnitrophota bacterium]